MSSIFNVTTVIYESPCPDDGNYKEVLERSIGLSIGILISILNLPEIIIIIIRIKGKRKIYEILLLSLSASDCMLGLSNAFVFDLHTVNACKYEVLVEIAFTLYIFSVLSSIFHIMPSALDRHLAVFRPIRHRVFSTRKKAYLYSGFLWILPVLISVLLEIINELTVTITVPNYMEQMQSQRLLNNSNINGFSEKEFNSTRPPVFRQASKSNHKSDLEYALSVVIIVPDVLIFTLFPLII